VRKTQDLGSADMKSEASSRQWAALQASQSRRSDPGQPESSKARWVNQPGEG